MNQFIVTCPDETATMNVGKKLASQLTGGELIELSGDLGSGKTTFVRGLAEGLRAKDEVTSPSFALKNVYAGRLRLFHFDLYRLSDPGLIRHEIEDALDEKDSAAVIEWAGALRGILPEDRIRIDFLNDGETSRKLKISFPGNEK